MIMNNINYFHGKKDSEHSELDICSLFVCVCVQFSGLGDHIRFTLGNTHRAEKSST